MNKKDWEEVEHLYRQLRTVKKDLVNYVNANIVGARDRDAIFDLTRACFSKYNRIINKHGTSTPTE